MMSRAAQTHLAGCVFETPALGLTIIFYYMYNIWRHPWHLLTSTLCAQHPGWESLPQRLISECNN